MSSKGMEGFKKQLKALKEKGADIDPEEIINDLRTPAPKEKVEDFKESFDKKAFDLMRRKINKLLDDFENHYGPKDRGLSVAIHIQKENSADRYAETFNYIQDKLSIVHIVDIGIKGVTEIFDPEKERQWTEAHNKKIAEAQAQVKEREERRKE